MTKKASIDLGTNTCILLICEDKKNKLEVLHDEVSFVRLGEGISTSKILKKEAIERTKKCLNKYKDILENFGLEPKNTLCVSTAQSRNASNSSEVFSKIKDDTGFSFKTISGDIEARLSFKGAILDGMDVKKTVVIDVGGGSTEFMSYSHGSSIDMGSVRYTEMFFKNDPISDEEFWNCKSEIDEKLEEIKPWIECLKNNITLVGVGGTTHTLARIHKGNSNNIDNTILSRGDIHRIIEELKLRNNDQRMKDFNIDEGRSDVIIAGSLIIGRSLEVLGFKSITVSTRGLRYGLIKDNEFF